MSEGVRPVTPAEVEDAVRTVLGWHADVPAGAGQLGSGEPAGPLVARVELDWVVDAQLYVYDRLRQRRLERAALTADQAEQLWDTATALVEVAYRARRAG